MYIDNEITHRRRRLMVEIVRLFLGNTLHKEIGRLPQAFHPAEEAAHRCCVYMDWAVIRYRIIALLGLRAEESRDESIPLRDFVDQALVRTDVSGPILTVMHVACTACNPSKYFVTNACHNCVAHSCMYACPKKCISIKGKQAVIDTNACVNCGMCMKACPYHAIVHVPVPCEEACPVDAISKDEDNKVVIDFTKCIFCGKCTRECPFSAIMERSEIIDVLKALRSGKKVIAMLAPSIVGQFPATLGQIKNAFRAIGFHDVVEVAHGADTTSRIEAEEFIERVIEKKDPFMGTSCCPAYVEAVKKHATDFKPYVSHAHTPMHYTAEEVRKQYPDCITVFVGPCLAKKHEALGDPTVDYVLTFEEAGSILVGYDVEVRSCQDEAIEHMPGKEGRGFPMSGGVTKGLLSFVGSKAEVKPVLIDGLSRKNVQLLKHYGKGVCPGNLIEVMACEGGCIAGPGVISNPRFAQKHLKDVLDKTPLINEPGAPK